MKFTPIKSLDDLNDKKEKRGVVIRSSKELNEAGLQLGSDSMIKGGWSDKGWQEVFWTSDHKLAVALFPADAKFHSPEYCKFIQAPNVRHILFSAGLALDLWPACLIEPLQVESNGGFFYMG